MIQLSEEAQTWKRIFAMLYLLKDDFSWMVANFKPPPGIDKKSPQYKKITGYHIMNVQNHTKISGLINSIHLYARSHASGIIHEEMTGERIKDMHQFMDTILNIDNIGEIGQILKDGLQSDNAHPELVSDKLLNS